jgi:S-adenosylmethionine decarboxylase
MNYRSGKKVGGTFRANAALLGNVGLISDFLRQLIVDLKMTSLGYHIYDVPMAVKRLGQELESDEGGISGLACLSTSHAAIHTWPEECGATFDVHSCRDFEIEVVENLIKKMFKTEDVEIHDLTSSLKCRD